MTAKPKAKEPMMSHDPLADMASVEEPVEAPPGEVEPADTPLALGSSLSIQDVALLLEKLRPALDLGGTLRLAAGEVEQVDAAGVQLLCAAVKDARAQNLDVQWDGVSERLRQAAAQLGLEQALAL